MKKVIFIVSLILGLIGLGIITGFLDDHPGLMAGLAVAGVFLVLLIGLLGGSMYSAWLIRTGARMVTEDRQASAAYAGLVKEMFRYLGRGPLGPQGGRNVPALPLPSQEANPSQSDWLPALTEFQDAEYSELPSPQVPFEDRGASLEERG